MTGDESDNTDMCVYISLSISQNAIVLSPTKAFVYPKVGKKIFLNTF
jgi:hypothetical protein